MGTVIFNGISTVDMGVVVQSPPVYEFPTKEYDVIHIEGRNGDIVIDKGSYQNTKRRYYLASVFRPGSAFVVNANAIAAWLMSANGYARLQDSYEPEYYRKALYRDSGELPNLNDKATVIQVSFECKPQRFLISGDTPIVLNPTILADSAPYNIENPTKFIALPEIVVTGGFKSIEFFTGPDIEHLTSSTKITLDVLTPTDDMAAGITIDSDLQDVYTSTAFINDKIQYTNGLPKLYPGKNWIKIEYTSASSVVSVKPKWWVL